MLKLKKCVVVLLSVLLFISCCNKSGDAKVNHSNTSHKSLIISKNTSQYTPPAIPSIVATDKEKMEYLAENYWRDFNFRDTTTIKSEVTERAFVNYLYTLAGVSKEVASSSITDLLESSSVDSLVFNNFIEICEKYLYDPNSPVRNDELYIPVLKYMVSSTDIDEWDKIRPQYQLDMALKNRVGTIATDFVITEKNMAQKKLSQIEGNYKLVLFNNPDCPDCIRVKEFIINNQQLFAEVTIISVYIDSDLELWRSTNYPKEWINGYDSGEVINSKKFYDIKAIPTIYLLDSDDRIILKDTPIEVVVRYLNTLKQ